MAVSYLDKTNITNSITLAQQKLDTATDKLSEKYLKNTDKVASYEKWWRVIQYITVLQDSVNLTNKEIETILQAMLMEAGVIDNTTQATTLTITLNQPALNVTKTLTVSGTANQIPVYDSSGNNLVDSVLSESGTSLFGNIDTLSLGLDALAGDIRVLDARGSETSIDLDIRAKNAGILGLFGGTVASKGAHEFQSSIAFTSGPGITAFSDDDALATASATDLVTERAIKTYVDAEIVTALASVSTITASNGLTRSVNDIKLGGTLTGNTSISLGATASFDFVSTLTNTGFQVVADTSFNLFGPTGGIKDTGALLQIHTSTLDYDVDNSGSFTARSVIDKDYADKYISGKLTTSTLQAPTGTEDGYSITWDQTAGRFTLTSVSGGGGGGGGNADTLDLLDSTQFLRSDIAATKTAKTTFDISAGSGASGREVINLTISSDNTYARIGVSRSGGSAPTYVGFYNIDSSADLQVRALEFNATGSGKPIITTSNTLCNNLNADLLDGYDASLTSAGNTVVVRDGSGDIAFNTLTVVSDSLVSKLNADRVDSYHATDSNLANTCAVRDANIRITAAGFGLGSTTNRMELYATKNLMQYTNAAGYIRIGASGGSQCSISTDQSSFVVDKPIVVTGTIIASNFIQP